MVIGPAAASSAPAHRLRTSSSPAATARLAARLAAYRPSVPAAIHLCGEVGAGKSEFARALIRSLGVSGSIPSPSFCLAHAYRAGDVSIGHFDFYRCADPDEWRAAGLDEAISGLDLVIIEWPQNAAGLPPADIDIFIAAGSGPSGRVFTARPLGAGNEEWLCRAWR